MNLLEFNMISEFALYLESQIKINNTELENTSKKAGEKLRNEKELETDKELLTIKEKLEEKTDDKKKKRNKKQTSSNWIKYDSINLYNGTGVKGELELYFKQIEDLKSKLEKLESTKKSLDTLISKGLKNDLKCQVFETDNAFDMVLLKTSQKPRPKFSFKKEFSVPSQNERPLFMENVIR